MPPVTILSEEKVPAGAQAAWLKFLYKGPSEPSTFKPRASQPQTSVWAIFLEL